MKRTHTNHGTHPVHGCLSISHANLAAIDDAINDCVDVLSLGMNYQLLFPGRLHVVAREGSKGRV
jgi:hypothetical protein